MTDTTVQASTTAVPKPADRPADARFSSGPCKKFPGHSIELLTDAMLGISHRGAARSKLQQALDRQRALLGLPDDWRLAIVPASDTGAVEMCLWSALGPRPVDVLVWESFSNDWAIDIVQQLQLKDARVLNADYGDLPDLSSVNPEADIVFAYNGTTSGVKVPNLDWIADDHAGVVICDATSAAFCMPMDFSKLDAVTWSWQKGLGGEAAHGMLAISPKMVERLESYTPDRPLPKLFRMTKKGKLNEDLFRAATINTPSLMVVEDLLVTLDWVDQIGGLPALHNRSQANLEALDAWVQTQDWIEWFAKEPEWRSNTAMQMKVTAPEIANLDQDAQWKAVADICKLLEVEGVAFDIKAHRNGKPGFRVWGGPTVDASDVAKLGPWITWAFETWKTKNGEA